MTLHFVHVRKTGGLAVKQALLDARLGAFEGEETRPLPETPFGRIVLHRRHRFRVRDVEPGDHAFFFVRDPVARFVSGFNSRLRKGQPRHLVEWTAEERSAFEAFPTPQRLATALKSSDDEEREKAHAAMDAIRHLRPMWRSIAAPKQLRERAGQIVYIGRQETLDSDWEELKALLELPPDVELPSDPVAAHRSDPSLDTSLDDTAVSALRDWYRRDYKLLELCDELRAERRWGVGTPSRRSTA